MSNPLSLFIGPSGNELEIPQSFNSISQTYEKLSARNDSRLAGGGLVRRTAWSGKIMTSISLSGTHVPGLDGIDFNDALVIRCVAPVGVSSTSNVITITADRRTDTGSDPYGMAFVPGNGWVDTPVSMGGNDATCTIVGGATIYKVFYFPEFTALFTEPKESSSGGLNTSVTISGQQI